MAVLVARQDRNGCGLICLAAPPSSNAPPLPAQSAKFREQPLASPVDQGWLGGLQRRALWCGPPGDVLNAIADELTDRLNGLQSDIHDVDRGLQVLATENATHEPVIGRVFLQMNAAAKWRN